MSDRLRRRYQKLTMKLQEKGTLEPDESVQLAVNNLTVPAWVFIMFGGGLLLLPYQVQKASWVVLTDKHVYILRGRTKVLLKARLGEISAEVQGNAFPGRCLVIGDQKIWLPLNKRFRERGYAIAEAVTRAPAPALASADAALNTSVESESAPAGVGETESTIG